MRKLVIAVALASTALATPAIARDNTPYVGVEGGVLLIEDFNVDLDDGTTRVNDAFTVNHNYGVDVDVVGGYDLGAFRIESELGYKRASIDEIQESGSLGSTVGRIDAGGSARSVSVMLNGLADFGGETGIGGYAGVGVGLASVRYKVGTDTFLDFSQSDQVLAWQAIAGIRFPVSATMEAGIKYRYFNTRKLKFDGPDYELTGRWRSHSLLASLIFNFGVAPPPPPPPPPMLPPPPPPPATQTCPDGSVILATDICPAPPPPPPPPPPAPERG